jgi:branched-subunit amino acid transport protein AzlD
MQPVAYSIAVIAIMAGVTFFTRAFPFLFFEQGDRPRDYILYLGKVLPPAIIAMLVVYCFRNVRISHAPHGLPELIAVAAVVLLHLWKRNNLISIAGGTVLYMVLVQRVFV